MAVTGEREKGEESGEEKKKDEVVSRDVLLAFVYRPGPSAPIFKDGLSSSVSRSAFHFTFLDIPAPNLHFFAKRVAQAHSSFLITCPKFRQKGEKKQQGEEMKKKRPLCQDHTRFGGR